MLQQFIRWPKCITLDPTRKLVRVNLQYPQGILSLYAKVEWSRGV